MSSAWQRYLQRNNRILSHWETALPGYRDKVASLATAGSRILHLGCGRDRSAVTSPLKDRCEVIGIDSDEASAVRFHSECWLTDAGIMPFGDNTFDLICCEYVFEHLEHPDRVMAEAARVLRPGGHLVVLTPNRWSYKSLAAALTPHWFHEFAASQLRVHSPRDAADVFPTYYRANTRGALRALGDSNGFELSGFNAVSNGPTWFARIPLLFELGVVFHRLIESFNGLAGMRCSVLACYHLLPEGVDAPLADEDQPLTVICLACRATMAPSSSGYACSNCGYEYRRQNQLVLTLR